MTMTLSKMACRVGAYLAKTRLGVFIIAHSYVHENYEWYRQLIFESEYSLDDIRKLIKKKDAHETQRADWLLARSKYAGMHCTDKELEELISYFND